eukprot:Nk52_evm10s374 gene=Nk52_evmTU10s374
MSGALFRSFQGAANASVKPLARRMTSLMAPKSALKRNVKGVLSNAKLPISAGMWRTFSSTPRAYSETMFCFHCEQHDKKMCGTSAGVCGKPSRVANLQDLLMDGIKGISQYIYRIESLLDGRSDKEETTEILLHEANRFYLQAVFSTLTNVNFDSSQFEVYVKQTHDLLKSLDSEYTRLCKAKETSPEGDDALLSAKRFKEIYEANEGDSAQMALVANEKAGVLARGGNIGNEDLASVVELTTYGLKGLCAYMHHASIYGKENNEMLKEMHFIVENLVKAERSGGADTSLNDLVANALKLGELNVRVLKMLNDAHCEALGTPSPQEVNWYQPSQVPTDTPSILVSGHDLHYLDELLSLTEGKGISIFTHGEMLPAHGYPKLRNYKHLRGHFGGPWNMQKMEFGHFPGSILMTSNCLMEPRRKYKDRIFTMGPVGFPGIKHLDLSNASTNNFDDVISKAEEYHKTVSQQEQETKSSFPETVMTGHGFEWILSNAELIMNMVKAGEIKHFFVIGGCDGSESSRSYFHELAFNTPKDSVILTLGCGKYRFNHLKLEPIQGQIPRILDLGQCNDAYGAVVVASTLAEANNCSINDLPISFAISWFEQKSIIVLLSCLHLGLKDIRLGPNLPAFVTPNILEFLVNNYGIRPTDAMNVKSDLKQMLG